MARTCAVVAAGGGRFAGSVREPRADRVGTVTNVWRVGPIAIGLLALGALAGCGGKSKPSLYSLDATRSCLQHDGYQAEAVANHYLPGSGGNLRVRTRVVTPLLAPAAPRGSVIPNTYVFLVFAKDAPSALVTQNKAIKLTIKTLNSSGEGVTAAFIRKGVGLAENVFYYSPSGPLTKMQRSVVTTCLG